MATQAVTATALMSDKLAAFVRQMADYHPGEDVTPYIDVRDFAGIIGTDLNTMGQSCQGSLVSTADGNTDGIDVALPFVPKAVIVHNQTTGLVYVKLASHSAKNALKITLVGPVIAYATPTVQMGNLALTNLAAFHIDPLEIAGVGEVVHFLALG